MIRYLSIVVVAAVLVLQTACADEGPTAPKSPTVGTLTAHLDEDQPYCDEVDEVPPGGCRDRPGGAEEDYFDTAEMTANFAINVERVGNEAIPLCPLYVNGSMVPALVQDPRQLDYFTIISTGRWDITNALNIFSRFADYWWPRTLAGNGGWPAIDGSGRQAYIEYASGICNTSVSWNSVAFTIQFYAAHGVRISRPGAGGGGAVLVGDFNGPDGSSGGSGPNQGSWDILMDCTEWVEPNGTYHMSCTRVA
jgi:hypothetical protein